jgi:hypothetical protein
MFRVFQKFRFEPPQHGDGMWPPLAYAIDGLGIVAGIVMIASLLFVASLIVPFIVR